MAKILFIEDNKSLSDSIRDWFANENHVLDCVYTAKDGQECLKMYEYDLLIIDWELPDGDGISICKDFRSNGGTTPILFLTGKGEIEEIETGLDAGADDYLTKPFNKKELSARTRALLRRGIVKASTKIVLGDLCLDINEHRITKAGKALKLSPKDFALLEFFMRHPDQVFSAEAIIDRVWHIESDVSPEAVRTHVKRVRRQIDGENKNSRIETIHRVGYKFHSVVEPTD